MALVALVHRELQAVIASLQLGIKVTVPVFVYPLVYLQGQG